MTPPAPALTAVAGALFVAAVGLGCGGPTDTDCDGAPEPGAVSLWTACGMSSLGAGSVPLVLTNLTAEPIWFYHECRDEVPWPEMLQDDGTWLRLLPDDFFLPISCQHVVQLAAGDSMELSMSTQHVERPGVYRAEMVVARGCGDVHDPQHVNHECEHVDFLSSAPFDLR